MDLNTAGGIAGLSFHPSENYFFSQLNFCLSSSLKPPPGDVYEQRWAPMSPSFKIEIFATSATLLILNILQDDDIYWSFAPHPLSHCVMSLVITANRTTGESEQGVSVSQNWPTPDETHLTSDKMIIICIVLQTGHHISAMCGYCITLILLSYSILYDSAANLLYIHWIAWISFLSNQSASLCFYLFCSRSQGQHPVNQSCL